MKDKHYFGVEIFLFEVDMFGHESKG
jgi:hypothetical protein